MDWGGWGGGGCGLASDGGVRGHEGGWLIYRMSLPGRMLPMAQSSIFPVSVDLDFILYPQPAVI